MDDGNEIVEWFYRFAFVSIRELTSKLASA